jgi:hypothetical protein
MTAKSRTILRIRCAMAILGLALTACGQHGPPGVSAPFSPDAPQRLCAKLGFMEGSAPFTSCVGRLEGLERQQLETQSQCEGIRQRALSTPFRSGGVGNTIATSDADYQSCMSGQLTPPAQLQTPGGRAVTCRAIQREIACD